MTNSTVQIFGLLLGLASGFCTILAVLLPEWRRNDPGNDILEAIIRHQGMFPKTFIVFIFYTFIKKTFLFAPSHIVIGFPFICYSSSEERIFFYFMLLFKKTELFYSEIYKYKNALLFQLLSVTLHCVTEVFSADSKKMTKMYHRQIKYFISNSVVKESTVSSTQTKYCEEQSIKLVIKHCRKSKKNTSYIWTAVKNDKV